MLDAMRVAAERLELPFDLFCERISVLTARHDRRHQRHDPAQGRESRPDHDEGARGRDPHHARLARRHLARHRQGRALPRELRSRIRSSPSACPRRIGARRLLRRRRGRRSTRSRPKRAIRELVAEGCEAIAICFLWSFRNPGHEQRVREMVRAIAPDLFVSCSIDIAPKWGEYERDDRDGAERLYRPGDVALSREPRPRAESAPLYAAAADHAVRRRVDLGRQGHGLAACSRSTPARCRASPASVFFGELIGVPNIITTDMGGTSFDVGIIAGGQPEYSFISNVIQYDYFLPKVDIQAIGSGGGSLARVNGFSRTLDGRSRQRRRGPGSGVLRQGQRDADGDRRRRRARLSRPRQLPRRADEARQGPGGGRGEVGRRQARPVARAGGKRHRHDRRVQDGRHHPQDDGREGPRPARVRAVRVRRRGAGARRPCSARSSACRR